jgi:hypothetical protein
MKKRLPQKSVLLSLLILVTSQYGFSQGQVSQSISQMLSIEQDKDNPPSSIYIKLNTRNVQVKYMKGTRVMVVGSVKLGIPNLFFLDVLIKKGRYTLFLIPDGSSRLRLEDKARQHMVLRGETCRENVSYDIYIPETIKTVVFEDAQTGDSNVIAMTSLSSKKSSTASSDLQVLIKDK